MNAILICVGALVCVSAAEPGDRGASVSEPVVRGVRDAHLSGGAAGPGQHRLLAARCESRFFPRGHAQYR